MNMVMMKLTVVQRFMLCDYCARISTKTGKTITPDGLIGWMTNADHDDLENLYKKIGCYIPVDRQNHITFKERRTQTHRISVRNCGKHLIGNF